MENEYVREHQNYFFNTQTEEIMPFDECISQEMWEEKYGSDEKLEGKRTYKLVFLGTGIGMNYDIYGNLLQWESDFNNVHRFYAYLKK